MTAFVIKIIASICMLLDHIGVVFGTQMAELYSWPVIFKSIGRIAFPIYAYMIAQGCKHTKNINKYLFRLGIFALISVMIIFLYNGNQGPKFKWAFYVFYPAHIAVLAAIWFMSVRL